ncbi:hypothetical protein C8R43DRAFT_1124317 [Mycena crocata]|nr:hypothetical protein C8R43DRAFT_1124317 [Mycena crocata]
MLSSSPTKLIRDFVLCTSLSFVILLSAINAGLRVYTYLSSTQASSPVNQSIWVTGSIQLSQVLAAHEYLTLVFKVTLACTMAVFLVREFAFQLGFGLSGERRERERIGDVEAGSESWDKSAVIVAAPRWRERDENTERRLQEFVYPVLISTPPMPLIMPRIQ